MRASKSVVAVPRRRSTAFKPQWIGRNASPESLNRYCNEVWAELIKERDGHKCFMCGREKGLTSHHLITRKWLATAFDQDCGITLCDTCHDIAPKSAHMSPWFLQLRLAKERPEQHRWLMAHRHEVSDGPQLSPDWREVLKRLLDAYQKIRPVTYERSNYFKFDESEERQIVHDFRDIRAPIKMIARKWGCSHSCIYGILERHGVDLTDVRERSRTKAMMQRLCGHAVIKIDADGKVVGEYPSMNEAARKHGLVINAIRNCVKGLSKTSGGFRWSYKKNAKEEQAA